MKHCLVLFLTAMFVATVANAQLVNNGATITVQSGATIKCTGAIINNGGTITNSGIVSSDGELRNESGGTLTGAGVYEATTKFINNGVALAGINLKMIGSSNTDSIKSGVGSSYTNVNLAKSAGNTATLSDAMTVTGIITFENDNNRLILEDENLIMGPAATFVSADNNEFVVTNNTGVVTKQSLGSTTFTYEVGFAANEYNPLSISNPTGTPDNISVRCLQNVLLNGMSGGTIATHFANNSWVVTEAVAGGSNLQLIAGWDAADEPAGGAANFNRDKVGIARYTAGTDWDLPANNVLAASGSDPFTRSRSGITTGGVFAIADLANVNAARLNLKVFLQGSYNAATTMMNEGLRTNNVIPTTQPYTAAIGTNFTRIGVYDGSLSVNETVPGTGVFDATLAGDDIIDWVYVSLQDGTTPSSKLQTRAALLQRDGDIVEYDAGTATYGFVRMPIDVNANYHIIVAHRNHLPVRTAAALALQDGVTSAYNFTTAQSQAYQDPAVLAMTPPNNNPAMKDLGNGSFAMWAGNVNLFPANAFSNTTVRASGGQLFNDYLQLINIALSGNFASIIGPPVSPPAVYSNADINMDGSIRATGGENLNDYLQLLNRVLGGNVAAIFTQHL